jgi:hypothetical protein
VTAYAAAVAACITVLFFCSSVYLGVFWGLHFFWFPDWTKLTVDNFRPQFFGPIGHARKFFTIVVILMYLMILALLVLQWNTPYRWFHVASFLLLSASFYVGNWLVFPINTALKDPGVTQADLTSGLVRWMRFNSIRTLIITVMWLVLMWYLLLEQFRAGSGG